MSKIKELRQREADLIKANGALLDKAEAEDRDLTEEEQGTYDANKAELTKVRGRIARAEEQAEAERNIAHLGSQPGGGEEGLEASEIEGGEDLEAQKPFANLGEQLQAIYMASQPGAVVDKRLLALNDRYQAAYAGPSGMNEGVDSEGGFAVQHDFAGMIFNSAVQGSGLLSRVDSYTVGAGSNGAKWVDIDESSIATTVFGGVQVYWAAEADTVAATKPKIKAREMLLRKLFGIAYASDEIMQDTTFISELYQRAFSMAIMRQLEGDVLAGNGAGKPLGIKNSGALVAVAKESGQAADTVTYRNFVSMWARRWFLPGANLIWLVHPDVEEQMLMMEFPVGTGGVPVFLPPAGASAAPYSTLLGRPVLPTDHCEALGDQGDVYLTDLSEYMLIKKGAMKSDTSIHVRFLYGEQTFRFTYRCNGAPKRNQALTIKNSSNTRSPYVTLAERA